jgi:ATP/ADP translocase
MLGRLFTALQVKQNERTQVSLVLAMGFFMGTFIATYQVTAESLFINQLSDRLDQAFLFSGILGIVSTILFSFLQIRIKFTNLAISSLVTVAFFTSLVYVLYHFGPAAYHDEVLFSMFILTGPLTAILLLCYWGIFGRLFNFKQSKRIIGWIDTGQLLAAIIAFFLIPLTAPWFPDTSNYLLACNVSIVGVLVCLLLISFRFKLSDNDPSLLEKTVKQETSFAAILKDRYTLLLGFFIVISMGTLVLNQYLFQTVLNKQYPDQRELTNFLAYFNGIIYLLSLIMQTFVNDKILSNYGIRVSLLILPIVIGILSFITFFTGLFVGYDLAISPSGFVFFFLSVAMLRLFNAMLRDSLENPVFKLLFIPLESRLRFGIQAKVEGTVSETGRFLAGILIFCFVLIPFFKLYIVAALIFVLAVGYLFIVGNLYAGYRTKIRAKLETVTGVAQEKLEIGYASLVAKLEGHLLQDGKEKSVFSYKLLEKINPSQVAGWVNRMVEHRQPEVREFAQQKLNEFKGLSVSERYVIRMAPDREGQTKNVLSKADLVSILNNGGEITKGRIQKLARSAVAEDRQYAAELLLHSGTSENLSYLVELLNDIEPKVRNTAIKTAIKKNNNEVILALIENLSSALFANQAANALTLIGSSSLSILDNAFYRSGQSTQVLVKIIQIMGRIGGQRAKDLLWNKIDYPDKLIVSQVLLSLGESGFKAGISQITRIKYVIEQDVADIAWNLGAIIELENAGDEEVLKALRRESQNDLEHIYMLLAMLYDTRSIQLVKENIESGTVEGTTYAIELLDVFLSEQLKQRVIPVLDDLSDAERLARLEIFYPRMKLDDKLVLKFIVNRDFNQTNRWTKATVLYRIGRLKIAEFKLDLIAQLFNPDRLLREVAAWSLYQINPADYEEHAQRLGPDVSKALDRAIRNQRENRALMVFEKVLFLQRISFFDGMPGVSLSFLADICDELYLKNRQTLVLDDKLQNYFFIVYEGSGELFVKGKPVKDYMVGEFIGEQLAVAGYAQAYVFHATNDSVLLRVNKDLFYELLAGNVRMADQVLEIV